ncbi:ABC transporter substrate-binding protein [Kibdelosporangium aridum]|uniref:Peptide/nickel transport system substrate-binding protein n=1 Tax=Kibdelosporangium aridum TaxID=2030 RepID=A0A1Y5Y4C9_KIBAR|nr:ABC transporter substrate-binding protein [Kibdelosporangium aridum]SMD25495.1 peptide/nickel transport system substrate-binding protein [Kibdelosporangium aridum]
MAVARSAILALVLTAAACSSDTGTALVTTEDDTTITGVAKSDVDSVTWYGDYRPLITLDPIKLADYPEQTVIPNICEPLLRMTPGYELQPGLARSATYVDPLRLEVKIRTDVRFSDGTPMTADDVVYSLRRNLDPKYASNYAGLYVSVRSIETTTPDTVLITFNSPDYVFRANLGSLSAAVISKKFAETAGDALGTPATGVMCTGPFAFDSYDGTSRLTLKRNDRYWDTANRAHAARFTFVFPSDLGALTNSLASGEVDGAFNVPSNLVSRLKSSDTGTVYVGQEASTPINIDMIVARPDGVLADLRVRQAISQALDRESIASTIFGGTADPLYLVTGPGMWGNQKAVYEQAYSAHETKPDVAAAKAKISQAGATGKTVRFVYPAGDPQSMQLATVIKQTVGQIGLTMEIVGLPNQQYGALFSDPAARAGYDVLLSRNYTEVPEPLLMDHLFGGKDGNTNFSGYNNPVVEQSFIAARGIEDPAKRAIPVIAAEKQLALDLPSIPIVQPRSVTYLNNRLTGATLTFSFMTSPWAAAIGGR